MNNLKRAIDTDLSRLRVTRQGRARIFENAMEGKKVKKKLSTAFVLVMVLVLAAAVALAVTLINNQYFENVATIESEHGYYDDWSLDEKLMMLKLMKDYGVDVDTKELGALLEGGMPDAEREKRIDALIIDRYGINGRTDVITLERVLITELGGGIETWNMEQKAWYSQMLIDAGMMSTDDDVFVMPGEDAITPDEAIAIAKAEIMRVWGLTEENMNDYAVDWVYFTHSSDTERRLLHYEVTFKPLTGPGHWLDCPVSRDGKLLSSADNEWFSSPEEQKAIYAEMENYVDYKARELFQQYATEHGFIRPVGEASIASYDWPLEHKKGVADLVRPVVIENMAKNPNYGDWTFGFYATHIYGVPDEKSITQEAAIEIARRALGELPEMSDELLAYCDSYRIYYEVTDPEAPLWKFIITAGRHWDEVEALGVKPNRFYRVVINAYTGEVAEAYSYMNGDGVTGLAAVERGQ